MQGPDAEEVSTVTNLERLQWEESQQENSFWHDIMVMGFQVRVRVRVRVRVLVHAGVCGCECACVYVCLGVDADVRAVGMS